MRVRDRSVPQQIDSFGGLHASPTKLALSKWLVAECVLAKASQSRRASMLAAPTWFITWKFRTCRCTSASTASWRTARIMESRAAIGPAQPVVGAVSQVKSKNEIGQRRKRTCSNEPSRVCAAHARSVSVLVCVSKEFEFEAYETRVCGTAGRQRRAGPRRSGEVQSTRCCSALRWRAGRAAA